MSMMNARINYVACLDEALDRADLGIKERRAVRKKARTLFRVAFAEFARDFGAKHGYEFGDDDGESDTPILDFWKWLIDSGKIQVFIKALVTEYLPALFELIIAFISALAVI